MSHRYESRLRAERSCFRRENAHDRGTPRIIGTMTRMLVAAAMVLAAASTATAQTTRNQLVDAIVSLQRAVEALGPGRPAELTEAVQWLRGRLPQTDPSQVSTQYLRTLTNAATLLAGSPNANLIDDITAELEAKIDHCRALGIGMGGSVLLRVNTRRGSETVNNWQVFYLLKIYERAPGTAPTTFETLSAPAQTRLEPGRYWIWARDPASGRTSERTLFLVSGKQEFRIDLPVP